MEEHGGGGSNFFWLPGWCRQWPWRGKVTRRADTGVRCRILHWTLILAIHIQLYNNTIQCIQNIGIVDLRTTGTFILNEMLVFGSGGAFQILNQIQNMQKSHKFTINYVVMNADDKMVVALNNLFTFAHMLTQEDTRLLGAPMQCQYMRDWVISQGQATKRWCHKRRQRSLLRAWNISNISDLCTEKIQIRGTLGTQSVHMTDGRLVGRPTQTFNALLSTQWALVGTWALGIWTMHCCYKSTQCWVISVMMCCGHLVATSRPPNVS